MIPHVALLRGINVGAGNRLPMAELRAMALDLKWENPRTYIASGNLVFRAPVGDHGPALSAAIRDRLGLAVPVLALDADRFRTIAAACPFRPESGQAAHVFFTFDAPRIDRAGYEALKTETETLAGGAGAVYLHAPDGIGRSKLAEKLHKVVTGTEMTGRNLNTVRKILDMLDAA